jgi:uncharacterized SAM-binding protein YcdF (DUF218 family)
VKTDRLRRVRHFASRVVLTSVAIATLVAAVSFPFAGRYLVDEDPLEPADAVFVLAGSRAARWMEAVELYKEKVAPHIVLSSDRMEGAEFELLARGIRLPRHSDLAREAMIQLGVPPDAVEVIRSPVDNTAQEAIVARSLAAERGWKRLLIVTSKYHTRRARFAFVREFRGSGVEVRMRATRYDRIFPGTWWAHRFDARWVLTELSKLMAYRLGLKG